MFQGACSDDQAIGDLRAAATEVSRALNDLLQQIKSCAGPSREVIFITISSQLNQTSGRAQIVLSYAGTRGL